MPVGHAKKAFILILHANPVLQRANVVSEGQLAGRAHAAEHAFARFGGGGHLSRGKSIISKDTEKYAGFRRSSVPQRGRKHNSWLCGSDIEVSCGAEFDTNMPASRCRLSTPGVRKKCIG